jgi:hypothetical protein
LGGALITTGIGLANASGGQPQAQGGGFDGSSLGQGINKGWSDLFSNNNTPTPSGVLGGMSGYDTNPFSASDYTDNIISNNASIGSNANSLLGGSSTGVSSWLSNLKW